MGHDMKDRSTGVGMANWIVNKTSGFLDARLSRRSFIARTTLLGTAIAATGCAVVTQPGSPYQRITDCPPNALCRDGYTEFCCAINDGVNACPPNTTPAGWWRADFSVFCNGTRYYIDCNEVCCGPVRGDGFCAGCGACSCAHGCDTRKVHCNYFRYGQCGQFIFNVGPIACRMVTCVPPYALDLGCSPSGAVDNSTANHFTDCTRYLPPAPPPPPPLSPSASVGSAVVRTAGELVVVVRGGDHAAYIRRLIAGQWSPYVGLGGACTSRIAAASRHAGRVDLFTRCADGNLFQSGTDDGASWSAWSGIGTGIGSDPAAIAFTPGLWVFVRVSSGRLLARPTDGTTWPAWVDLGGTIESNPVPAVFGSDLFVFARGADNGVYFRRFDGTVWQDWVGLGGDTDADPGAVALGAHLFVFQKTGPGLQVRVFDGTTWDAWSELTGTNIASSPKPIVYANKVFVFVRGIDHGTHYRQWDGTTWNDWVPLGGFANAAPEPAAAGANLYVFVRGADNGLWYRSFAGVQWSDWVALGGDIDAVSGAG